MYTRVDGSLGFVRCQSFTELLKNIDNDKRDVILLVHRTRSPRPHWGKLFTMSPASLKDAYKRMPEFLGLCRKYDPLGKFRNEFLNKNIFGD